MGQMVFELNFQTSCILGCHIALCPTPQYRITLQSNNISSPVHSAHTGTISDGLDSRDGLTISDGPDSGVDGFVGSRGPCGH